MKRIVFLTGAGISKASGLATFRDSVDGLWNNYRIEDVATKHAYSRRRRQVIDFYNARRREVDAAEPNEAHLAIARLNLEDGVRVSIITQNVDNLHERASASTPILHLHGSLHRAQVKRYRTCTVPWHEDITDESLPEPGWVRSKGSMRHDVVLFGEEVRQMKEARNLVRGADVLIVCGTSLAVFPAASLIDEPTRAYKVLVDPNPVELEKFALWIASDAEAGVPEAIEVSRNHFNK